MGSRKNRSTGMLTCIYKNDVMEMLHDDEQEEEERLGCLHDENTYRKATRRWTGARTMAIKEEV